jgi:protein-L-isoaspartate(D-aspartate) O-methyltransferase
MIEQARETMVADSIEARGIDDAQVLRAMREVPRHEFLPQAMRDSAYRDSALPIDEGQTISQPYIVALMAQAARLAPHHHVLEIGTGSGYGAAVLSRIAATVDTIERHEPLAAQASAVLTKLGYANVRVHVGDGTRGVPERAPYDAIVVTAGGPGIPRALLEQLAPNGRLVMPVGPSPESQVLIRVSRDPTGGYAREELGGVRFVPLIGEAGWSSVPR